MKSLLMLSRFTQHGRRCRSEWPSAYLYYFGQTVIAERSHVSSVSRRRHIRAPSMTIDYRRGRRHFAHRAIAPRRGRLHGSGADFAISQLPKYSMSAPVSQRHARTPARRSDDYMTITCHFLKYYAAWAITCARYVAIGYETFSTPAIFLSRRIAAAAT